MKTTMKKITGIGCGLLLTFSLFFCDSSKADQAGKTSLMGENKKEKKEKHKKEEAASAAIEIAQKWELPEILKEVSGIAYLDKDRFACVQDESGVIFIYNTATAKIEKQVAFGAAGDYEGLALVNKTAYVVRSDGKIFEVKDIYANTPDVKMHTTLLNVDNNVEGIAYDAPRQRLLLAIKGAESGRKDYKGIYAFDLKTKKLAATPVLKINLKDPMLAPVSSKKLQNALQPSEIAVNPVTGLIYLTEATNPQLLELTADGRINARYKLDSKVFTQPEGIAFGPAGELYISNEGKKTAGTIVRVNLK
jgi:uncharacterized protein YjiK